MRGHRFLRQMAEFSHDAAARRSDPSARGGQPKNLKWSRGVIALVPFGVVTLTSTSPGVSGGEVAVIELGEFTV